MAAKQEKRNRFIRKGPKTKSKDKIYKRILAILPMVKTIFVYFCIPFTLALSFALFITHPRADLSNEVVDWRDSGYTYEFQGKEIFYQGNCFCSLIVIYKGYDGHLYDICYL